ncbi:MAG TPA: ectoine/hydroxyectoine ABC transporter substrate-binding protein EhuB [Thermoanaerobaculia bacterium]|nr:ectoine/hydroxyectoine ABC transporter substrate-binding protein EhuB [Thermoanaerobaculia bacterium]
MGRSARGLRLVLFAAALGLGAWWLLLGGANRSTAPEGAVRPGAGTLDAGTLDAIRATGRVRIGYANEAPYAYLDRATGEVTGEAPTLAQEVLRELGAEHVDAVLTEFGSLIPGLQAGRFDLIAAGMYVTPERCREIQFSSPTYAIGEAFVVRAGNPLELHSYRSVAEHEDATLGVVAGTIERRYAREESVPDDRVVVFPDAPSAVAGVAAGRVDAFAGTSLTVGDLLAKSSSDRLERAEPFHDPVVDGRPVRGYGAFGFRKSDRRFAEAFDAILRQLIGTERHLELVAPFGFGRDDLPPPEVTTESLCRDR